MPPPATPGDGAAPSGATVAHAVPASFPPDPRCHMLAVVLLAGYSLRAMNLVRDSVPGGLNAALILLDVLQAEREARAGTHGARVPRSILAMTAALDVPRETVRRVASALVSEGWLQQVRPGGYETSLRARRWFSLDRDVSTYAEFVWTARQMTSAMTCPPGEVDALLAAHPWATALATRRDAVPNPAYLRTMPALQEAIAHATASDKVRAAGVVDGYLHRHLKRLRATFDGDLLVPLIIGEIAHRNISMLGRRGDAKPSIDRLGSRFGTGTNEVHQEFLRVNAYSLSQSMGVPDATMRRRIAELCVRQWVRIDPEGNLAVEGEAVRLHSAQCNLEALDDLMAGYRSLAAMGMTG